MSLATIEEAVADIIGGVLALLFGVGILTGRIRGQQAEGGPATGGRLTTMLGGRVSMPTAALAGPATHLPGLFYLIALNVIVAHNPEVPDGTFAVLTYNAVWFALPLLALGACIVRPAAARDAIGSVEQHRELALPADQFDLWYGFPQSIAFKQIVDGQPRYLTTVMTEKAVGFIKQSKPDQPFCLIVAFKEPHGPRNYFDPEFKDPLDDKTIAPPANLTRESFEKLPEIVRRGLNATFFLTSCRPLTPRFWSNSFSEYSTLSKSCSNPGSPMKR